MQAEINQVQWRHHGLKRLQAESCSCPTDSCNFLTEEMWVFKVSNSPKWGNFQPTILYFLTKFSDKKEIFRQAKI